MQYTIMNQFKRDRHRKKIQNMLASSVDESFFQMIWATDALQTGRQEIASQYLKFPVEFAVSDIASEYAVQKWELETLIGLLLLTKKAALKSEKHRVLNCANFTVIAKLINNLRALEDVESGIFLKRLDVMLEMHRIAQRQFPWQRGYANKYRLYRYAYIYGRGECAEYFKQTYGLTMNEFSLVSFALYVAFQKQPWLMKSYSMEGVGITPVIFSAALNLLSAPLVQVRRDAVKLQDTRLPVAYQPNLLRRTPVISFGGNNEKLCAPLPELIILRATSGIFYDLIKGGAHLRNEASERFESYCAQYISATMERFDVVRSHKYRCRGKDFDTPDILIKDGEEIVVVVECKARKLSFGAQFANDPIEEAKSAYNEIAKGVFQIWQYFSHVRRNLIQAENVSPSVQGMVLTLDTWLMMSNELKEYVLATATAIAAEKDLEITDDDRRPVVFCTVEDLEKTIDKSDEDIFLDSISAACEEEYAGWVLPNVRERIAGACVEKRDFPFDLSTVLPWWGQFN